MIRGTRPQQSGFTIIEVIIYLTISIAIVAGSIALFSTRIPKTQFNQALVELDQKIRDTSGEVASGFYPSTATLSCNGTSISASGDGQGSNAECVFLGRAIQFGPGEDGCSSVGGEDCDTFKIYSIWGRTSTLTGSRTVSSLDESQPRFLDTNVIEPERFVTGFGLYVTKVIAAGGSPVGGVAFLQTFGTPNISGSDDLPSGASQVEMRTLGGNLGQNEEQFTRSPGGTYASIFSDLSSPNPSSGVTLCLRSAVSEQYATMTIGDGSRPLSNKVEILGKTAWEGICT